MALTVTKIRVLISCPGDVEEEKAVVKKVCDELNQIWGDEYDVVLEHFEWKENVVPIYGPRPQEVINTQTDPIDVYVGIFWRRFGTPTGVKSPTTGMEFMSGTEEEFYRAVESSKLTRLPYISVFFKSLDSTPLSPEEMVQQSRVIDFRQRIQRGWVVEFTDSEDFEGRIRKYLSYAVKKADEIRSLRQLSHPPHPGPLYAPAAYPDVEDYIIRKVVKAEEADPSKPFFLLEGRGTSMSDLILGTRKILLLGEAGIGKSSELKRLAYDLSKKDSTFVPVFATLNKYVQHELEDYLAHEFGDIPRERAVVLLDGLDEVESKNRNAAIRQIEFFSERNPLTRIIVSCRTNLSQPIDGFEQYNLLELSGNDIEEYIQSKLSARSKEFNRQAHNLQIEHLLKNPFNLTHVVKSFKETNSLPSKRTDILESFIDYRIKIDEVKYRTAVSNLAEKKKSIIRTLETISLTMEVLGRNHLGHEEFVEMVHDDDERDIIRHSGLLKKHESETANWQFEHNNFQEYLAARVLTRQSIETIKEFTAFKPDFRKTKPTWINTLSFLFNLPDKESDLFKEILAWVVSIEPELLVKFEPGNIDVGKRVEILKRIFEEYKRKGIWIDHEKFQYKELGRFAQSTEGIEYLLNEIKAAGDDITIGNAMYILRWMSIPEVMKERVKDLLLALILDPAKQNFTRGRALNMLTDVELGSREVADLLVPILRKSDDSWLRFSLYHFLYSVNLQDEYVDVFIEGIPYIRMEMNPGPRKETRLGDESYHLKIGLQKITTPSAISKLLRYFQEHPKEIYYSFMTDDLPFIVVSAAKAYEEQSSVYDSVFSVFMKLVETHQEKEASAFLAFFDMTGTRAKAFEQVYQSKTSIKDWVVPLATLAYPGCVDFIADEFLGERLTERDIWTLRNFIGWKNRSLYAEFHQRINDRTGDKFPMPETRDYDGENKKRFAGDINLLFDRKAFVGAIEEIYRDKGKEVLTKDDLFEARTKNWEGHPLSDLAIDTLLKLVGSEGLSFEIVNSRITTNLDWDFFTVSTIHEFLSHGHPVELEEKQSRFIQNWCLSKVEQFDFKPALWKNPDAGISTNTEAVILWYFLRRMDLNYPKGKLLDMLSFDWVEGHEMVGIGYLEKKLTSSEIKTRILQNLKEGITIPDVLRNHLNFCQKHGVEEVKGYAKRAIIDGSLDESTRRTALETLTSFENVADDLEEALEKTADDFKWQIAEKLVQNGSKRCENYLLGILSTGSDPDKFRASEFLIELQNMSGLRHYVNHVRREMSSPTSSMESSPITKLTNKDSVPLILELLELSYHEDFKQDRFERFEGTIRAALQSIAMNHDGYEMVKTSVEDFIAQNRTKYRRAAFLNAFLETLERTYYLNQSEKFSFDQALSMAKEII